METTPGAALLIFKPCLLRTLLNKHEGIMDAKYLRLWFRTEGNWFHEEYATDDHQWREAFLLLKSAGANVRIEYVDKNNLLHLEKNISGYFKDQQDAEQSAGADSSTLSV